MEEGIIKELSNASVKDNQVTNGRSRKELRINMIRWDSG